MPRAMNAAGAPSGGQPGDVLVRLRSSLPSLQPAEQRVAQVVIGDPAASAHLSITGLAEKAATSVATVARFARKAGFDGYPELRIALAGAAAREDMLGVGGRQPPAELDESASLADVVSSIVHHETRALQETAEHLDLDAMQAAVDAIGAARRIDIFGVGASGGVATDLRAKLHRIGRIAFSWKEVHAASTAAALLGEGDVAIGISHSGATLDTVEPLTVARNAGARTVAVTNFAGSPLAEAADIVLTTAARETTFRSGATASRTAQLAVVDILFVAVARLDLAGSTSALSKTHDALSARRLSSSRAGAADGRSGS
ncbi:MurR/RpiR family transcriptional regulator [Luteipulveratus flavus]|uniref:MurR/RpiR family transcriptional regulator n=1 Tax=Luteipulveratus flavus TaxID=3031728 RepID=A0ABT6C439_9MICO|nr:MurR/RpiR family transcriptional regulator [Luteipulveratus sp. YIM 133296]MDF8263500.1 MurR/RpiR family transcriptional regulator [Luteipulveratus sp. YIM 133296]